MIKNQADERLDAILSELPIEVVQAIVMMARVGYDEREGK